VAFLFAVACMYLFFRAERLAAAPIVAPGILGSWQMRIVGALALATGLVEASMVFLPSLAVTALHVSASRASFMLVPLVLALIAGSMIAGRLLDAVGPRPVIQFGMASTVIGLLLFALLPTVTTSFYLAGIAVGLGLSSLLGAPLRYVALQVGGEANRGASQGMLRIFLSSGQLFGASLTGGVTASVSAATFGYRRAMLIIAVGCCLALVTTLGLRNRHDGDAAGVAGVRDGGME
jgi:MFS family permease